MIAKQFIFLLIFSTSGILLAQGKASDRKATEHNPNEHEEHIHQSKQQNRIEAQEHGSEGSHSKDLGVEFDHGDHEHVSEYKDKHQHEKDQDSHDQHEHTDEEVDHEGHGDHDDDHHEESFGKNKAIQEVKNEGQEFRLSETAIHRLGIQTKPLNAQKKGKAHLMVIPKHYLVFSQNDVGLFISRDRWFRFIHAEVIKKKGKNYEIKIPELPDGHQLVTEGVPLLRVAQLEAMGKGGKGHVH